MIIDLETTVPPNKHFDVCIMGAGPAGITTAIKLGEAGYVIALLEGGGEIYDQKSQSLYSCETTGTDLWPASMRLRYFGGTSNHWAGRCRPFDASDFDQEHYSGMPGWPIEYQEIERHLPEAMNILDLPAEKFSSINPSLAERRFAADAFQKSPPTRFALKYKEFFEQSENVILFLNANAINLDIEPDSGQVKAVEIKNYSNKDYSVTASEFVLSMGAIENARFLLNQEYIHRNHKMVGSCLMEHLNVKLGEFILKEGYEKKGRQFFTHSSFTEKYKIGKSNITFGVIKNIKTYGRTAKIKKFFKTLACEYSLEDKIQFITEFQCPGEGRITTLMEQAPGLHSFVALSKDVDDLGQRKALVNWKIDKLDEKTIRKVAVEVAKSFADSGLGIVKLEDYILDPKKEIKYSPHAHHMGTTRMARDEKSGVVDKNCKVFHTDNLYVAGSSIFATGGACNPTMPIIQFCLRLSDHLNTKLRPLAFNQS